MSQGILQSLQFPELFLLALNQQTEIEGTVSSKIVYFLNMYV